MKSLPLRGKLFMRIVKQSVMVAPNKLTSTNMEKIPKLSITVILLSIVLAGCNDSITGDQIDLSSLQKQFRGITAPKALDKPRAVSDMIPLSRDELSSLRTVVKVCNGEHNAGLIVPGFGGVRAKTRPTSMFITWKPNWSKPERTPWFTASVIPPITCSKN